MQATLLRVGRVLGTAVAVVLPLVLPVLSVALLVSLAVTDLRMPGVREFWAEHAMLTNLLSSVLFVVLGLTIVNGWLRWREARRVRLVIIVAFASVGRFLLAYRRIMWFLLYGGQFLGDPDFRVTDAQTAALRDVLARHGLSEVDEHAAVQDDGGSAARQMHARLCILAADLDWVLLAHDLLRNTFFRSRIVLSRWASLLVTTDVSSAALQEMAEQAYDGGDLFVEFRDHIRRDRPREFGPDDVPDLARRWRMVFTNTVVLYWRLSRLTGQQSRLWPTDGRNLLLPVDRQLLGGPGDRRTYLRIRSTAMRPYRCLDDLPRWTEAEYPADEGGPVEPLA